MELSRRHDGSIGIAGMEDRYDRSATEGDPSWGTLFALTYTLPRKTLQLTGAPKTRWCKTYQLPARPWGNANDDIFNSPEPANHASIDMQQLMDETVETGASLAVFEALGNPDVSDEVLLKYMHHPEYAYRSAAVARAVSYNRDHLVAPLLKSEDPRLRHVGLMALAGMFKGEPLPDDRITAEMFALAGKMVDDPDESWWVKIAAMNALARAKPQTVAEHVDALLALLDSKHWWVSSTAAKPLALLASRPTHYEHILLPLIETITEGETVAGVNGLYGLAKQLGSAKPKVKELAGAQLKTIYANIPKEYEEPSNGIRLRGKASYVRKCVAWALERLPGGEAFINSTPKMTLAAKRSGHKDDLYIYSGEHTPNPAVHGLWVKIGEGNPARLDAWVKDWKKRGAKPLRAVYGFQLQKGGRMKGQGLQRNMGKDYFWSGDMLIGKYSVNEARRMKVKTVGGIDFLLVEKGGFGTLDADGDAVPVPKDWHCGYTIYIRDGGAGHAEGSKKPGA
jgi:hypothetical protein